MERLERCSEACEYGEYSYCGICDYCKNIDLQDGDSSETDQEVEIQQCSECGGIMGYYVCRCEVSQCPRGGQEGLFRQLMPDFGGAPFEGQVEDVGRPPWGSPYRERSPVEEDREARESSR